MTIDHRDEAEKHLATASRYLFKDPADTRVAEIAATIGQGHAALARDEEQAARTADLRDANQLLRRRDYAMREAVSAHIADALISKNPERWKAGRDLAQALDKADANIDKAIDSFVSDAGYDPKTVWNKPGEAQPFSDPWATKPDITADIPEPVRRVIAERLADMLLDRQDDWHAEQARRFTFALKNEGADLTGDIKKRITDLTLGRDPSDPPF